jgi:hypothetical protein
MTDKYNEAANLRMKYDALNRTAFNGTAEELKEVLLDYGHDKNFVLAIQNGLNGEHNDGTDYKGKAVDLEAKTRIMAEFRAKTGDFAQKAPRLTTEAFNRQAARIKELEAKVKEQEKTIEQLKKKNPPEYPSIH